MKCIYSHEGGAYCDKHDHGAVTVGCCGEENCPDRKVQTNADRLRSMSDEELAEWILREPTIGYFAVCPPGTKDGEDCPTSPCEQCWLDWLKAPAEEVQDGT